MTIHISHRVTAAPTPVNGDLTFDGDLFKKLPGPYGEVKGSFTVTKCANLTTLKDGPEEVAKDFKCFGNLKLQSLSDGPWRVGGGYRCSNNPKITSLRGCPLDLPKGVFNCANNPGLESFVGAPKKVGGNLKADGCSRIHSLEGFPMEVHGNVSFQMMTALVDISSFWRHCKHINGVLDLTGTTIEKGGLGLLLVTGLAGIKSEQKAMQIISRHLGEGPAGVMHCRRELIADGFDAFTSM